MRDIFFIVALVIYNIIYIFLLNLFIINKILLNLFLFINIYLKFIYYTLFITNKVVSFLNILFFNTIAKQQYI